MTKARPRALDLYPPEYHRVLEAVHKTGKFYVCLASSKEAMTIKMDFNRYKQSVEAFMPEGSWEVALVKNLMIRVQHNAMEFVRKSSWGAIEAFRETLDSGEWNSGTVDAEAEALNKMDEL